MLDASLKKNKKKQAQKQAKLAFGDSFLGVVQRYDVIELFGRYA